MIKTLPSTFIESRLDLASLSKAPSELTTTKENNMNLDKTFFTGPNVALNFTYSNE
jgi:hypothetical protein